MKVLSLIVAPGLLALAISVANADPGPTPEAAGAQTMPSGAEPENPPPATYDPGTPGTAPATTTDTGTKAATAPDTGDKAATTPDAPSDGPAPDANAPAAAPAAAPSTAPAPATTVDENNAATPPPGVPAPASQTSTGATHIVLPPPPNGQTVEDVPVAPLPPLAGAQANLDQVPINYSRVGVGMMVGGGFNELTNGGIKSVTSTAGAWTARVVAGTREYVGAEAAYVGDARSITGLGFGSSSLLLSNGLEGNFRVNVPIGRGASLIEPFGFVGVGWSHYSTTNNNASVSDVAPSDNVLTLPYGGGLEYAYRGFIADARFTFRQTYFNNMTSTVGGNLNNWGVGGQLGFEY